MAGEVVAAAELDHLQHATGALSRSAGAEAQDAVGHRGLRLAGNRVEVIFTEPKARASHSARVRGQLEEEASEVAAGRRVCRESLEAVDDQDAGMPLAQQHAEPLENSLQASFFKIFAETFIEDPLPD